MSRSLYSMRMQPVLLVTLLLSGCAPKKSSDPNIQPYTLTAPESVVRPLDSVIEEFGNMIEAYGAPSSIVLDVDLIENETGITKEIPGDLSGYVREVASHIPGVATTKVYPTVIVSGPGGPEAVQNGRPGRPQATFRIVGAIHRASEIRVVGKSRRIDLLIGNKPQSDDQFTKSNTLTTTAVVISLGIERSGGYSIQGDFATFRLPLDKNEFDKTFALYLQGSGLGGEKRITVSQDLDSAIRDAVAASLITIVGRALALPYWRLGNGQIFSHDDMLENRVKHTFQQMSTRDLEMAVKSLMYSDGYDLDMSTSLPTAQDRTAMTEAIHAQQLQYDDKGLADFALMKWKSLHYLTGADRAEARSIKEAKTKNEADAATTPHDAASHSALVDGSTFGWAKNAPIILLDMRLISETIRPAVLAAAKTCPGYADYKEYKSIPGMVAIEILPPGGARDVQKALRMSTLPLTFLWTSPGILQLGVEKHP